MVQTYNIYLNNFDLFSNLLFSDRAVVDTIRNLSLKNEPTRKSSSEYISTITKKQLQYKKHKQVVPDSHHSGTNIARTLLSIFGMFFYINSIFIYKLVLYKQYSI